MAFVRATCSLAQPASHSAAAAAQTQNHPRWSMYSHPPKNSHAALAAIAAKHPPSLVFSPALWSSGFVPTGGRKVPQTVRTNAAIPPPTMIHA